MHLKYLILYVPDVTAAVEFYEKAFGLKRLFIHEGGDYAQLDTGSVALSFCSEELAESGITGGFRASRPSELPAGMEIGFETDDVAGDFARAVEAGAEAVTPPMEKPWGQKVSYVRDLNGFLIEICSPVGG